MIKQLIFSIIILVNFSAFAGGSIAGNGGDVVYCENNLNEPRIQLLDLYELKLFEGKDPLSLLKATGNAYEKVSFLIQHLKYISRMRFERYTQELLHFQKRIKFVENELPNLPDDLSVVLPVGCKIRQIAIQQKNNSIPTYLINRELWNELDENQKAALILHEIVYSENIDGGHKDSRSTRMFTRTLLFGLPLRNGYFKLNYFLEKIGIYTYIERITESGEVKLGIDGYCGFKAHNHDLVQFYDYCNPDSKKSLNIIEDGFGRIAQVFHPTQGLIYQIPGAEIALTEPFSEYSISRRSNQQSFTPINRFHFKGFTEDVTCLPGKPVTLRRIDKNADLSKFNFSQSQLVSCNLDPQAENIMFLFGGWRKVLKAFDKEYRFAKPELVKVSDYEFVSDSYRESYITEFFNVQLFQISNSAFTCTVGGELGFQWSSEQLVLDHVEFQKPCIIKGLGKNPLIAEIDFHPGGDIHTVRLTASAEVVVDHVLRPLPPGTLLVSDIQHDRNHYLAYFRGQNAIIPGKVQAPDNSILWIYGEFTLFENGTLNTGYLAKESKINLILPNEGTCKSVTTLAKVGSFLRYSENCKKFVLEFMDE